MCMFYYKLPLQKDCSPAWINEWWIRGNQWIFHIISHFWVDSQVDKWMSLQSSLIHIMFITHFASKTIGIILYGDLFKFTNYGKISSHTLHWYGCFPECIFKCLVGEIICVKFLLQVRLCVTEWNGSSIPLRGWHVFVTF